MLLLAKLQNHLTLVIAGDFGDLLFPMCSSDAHNTKNFLVVPYIMKKKFYVLLKEQQLCRSKPYLVQGVFCIYYLVC